MRRQDSTTSATVAAGTVTTARSTGSGMSVTDAYARTPCTETVSGLTGNTGPEKLLRNRFTSTAWPSLVGSADAPMTAIDRGESSRAIDRASARCSRDSTTALDLSVGPMSKTRSTTPESYSRVTEYPASMKTLTIWVFSLSTSAVKRRMPRSCAAAARCSSRIEPRPRRCWSSSTTNATSAASVSPAGVPVVGAGGDDLPAEHGDQADGVDVVDVR